MRYPLAILFVALCVLALGQAALEMPRLPALLATHFDAAGEVTGWMSRGYFFRYQVALTLGFTGFFALIALLVSILPDHLLNLPHREYWLAPPRRAETRRRLTNLVLASGCGTLAFFAFLHQRICAANLDGSRRLTPPFGVILAVAVVLIVGPVLQPLLQFARRPPPA